jgi:hypothetical protein
MFACFNALQNALEQKPSVHPAQAIEDVHDGHALVPHHHNAVATCALCCAECIAAQVGVAAVTRARQRAHKVDN